MNALLTWLAGGTVTMLALFRALEARGRRRWAMALPLVQAGAGPYRSTALASGHVVGVPGSVRLAAAASLLFALVAPPTAWAVLDAPHVDGIAVLLLPAFAFAVASASAAAALLTRAEDAVHFALLTGRSSLFLNGAMTIVALGHLLVVESEHRAWIDRLVDVTRAHSCSRTTALAVLGLALAGTVQALCLANAATAHGESGESPTRAM